MGDEEREPLWLGPVVAVVVILVFAVLFAVMVRHG